MAHPASAVQPTDKIAFEDGETVQKDTAESKTKPRRQPARLWCQLLLHKQHQGFDLTPMLIGRGGCIMRDIHIATKAKVRIRGRGSGYFEVDGKSEAPVPLMVVVSGEHTDKEEFKKAV